MTTPKELADKAKREASHAMAIARVSFETVPAITALHATIDQLQAMAEASQATIQHLREAWATLHNLSVDMDAGPVRQQMQKRAQATRAHLDSLEQPDGSYQRQGSGEPDTKCGTEQYMRGFNDAKAQFAPPSAQQATGDEPDWDECIRQAEVATGLKVERNTMSIVIREVRRWLMTKELVAGLQATGSGQVLTVDDMARVLQAAWAKAEPNHGVTLNPTSYWSTFADMARAALAAATQAQPEIPPVSARSSPQRSRSERFVASPDGRSIDDDDFIYDASLKVYGDFEDDTSRHSYAQWLCNTLNAATTTGKREPLTPDHPDLIPRGFLLQWPAVGGKRHPVWNDTDAAAKSVGCPSEPLFALRGITGEQR
jgi:hypothetical protein